MIKDNSTEIPFHIIIPARLQAVRLPGKMLLDVQGKPLIQRTYERALDCGASSITIATDDREIQRVALGFGANVCMTSPNHSTGTDRLAEAVQMLGFNAEEIVVNIQGDEPLVPAKAVFQAVLAMKQQPLASVTTLCSPIRQFKQLKDPNVVKVVLDKQGFALYFSRAPIPFDMSSYLSSLIPSTLVTNHDLSKIYFRHLGLYAYRVEMLQQYADFEPAALEMFEKLEQLRILWQGKKIHVSVLDEPLPPGVDTLQDLEEIRSVFV